MALSIYKVINISNVTPLQMLKPYGKSNLCLRGTMRNPFNKITLDYYELKYSEQKKGVNITFFWREIILTHDYHLKTPTKMSNCHTVIIRLILFSFKGNPSVSTSTGRTSICLLGFIIQLKKVITQLENTINLQNIMRESF